MINTAVNKFKGIEKNVSSLFKYPSGKNVQIEELNLTLEEKKKLIHQTLLLQYFRLC